ncbi:hypothetical protein CLF_100786 [Clonorchis sinensis]|uniref:Uncharacterized protein n=1 Tax=Clonorchis sinensis TaxID=79923 RepID=G7Y488_CLOSI|nr:hypothetical protein CLF_100786 [Clonorchis sinensis]
MVFSVFRACSTCRVSKCEFIFSTPRIVRVSTLLTIIGLPVSEAGSWRSPSFPFSDNEIIRWSENSSFNICMWTSPSGSVSSVWNDQPLVVVHSNYRRRDRKFHNLV